MSTDHVAVRHESLHTRKWGPTTTMSDPTIALPVELWGTVARPSLLLESQSQISMLRAPGRKPCPDALSIIVELWGLRHPRCAAVAPRITVTIGKTTARPDQNPVGPRCCFASGAMGIRTPDLFHAMEARYQLRHSPAFTHRSRERHQYFTRASLKCQFARSPPIVACTRP